MAFRRSAQTLLTATYSVQKNQIENPRQPSHRAHNTHRAGLGMRMTASSLTRVTR